MTALRACFATTVRHIAGAPIANRQPIIANRQPIIANRQPIIANRQPIIANRWPSIAATGGDEPQ
ncbi:hypothetical protein [Halopenitus persicus]|uniref:hypothetical protein n=1 Tax=Halopenitus persicus TaxID=1048396 RepID=UPI000BBB6070|nr:hypothetical protein [Halopenitus persicus]